MTKKLALAWFLISIVLNAKHEKLVGKNQDLVFVCIQKFQATVGRNVLMV